MTTDVSTSELLVILQGFYERKSLQLVGAEENKSASALL